MTIVYLALGQSGHESLERWCDDGNTVDLLVAYPYWKQVAKLLPKLRVRRLCIDSGAFSVYNSGASIDLASYMDFCVDHPADDVFGLDVVADERQTRINLERMWARGIEAIPVWRVGESWEHLSWCAQRPKIAFARTGSEEFLSTSSWSSMQWLQQAFARVWPKRVHGLAMASKRMLSALPWHSVDATSWVFSPRAMGNWAGYTGTQKALRGRGCLDVRVEIAEHAKRARHFAWRWRRELAMLESAS